ncbi:MAG: HlyC/CorC family transporter [Chitinophagales bacterium]|nr:HlyC/CorC family transporter [Chitinophagales bacterium]
MTLLILFFVLSISFSFLCSIWEAVLLSINPSYISTQVSKGTATGKLLKEYKKDIDKPLSAILTLNTIAHTVGAIGVGAQAGKVFGENYFNIWGFHLSYESLIAGAMTLAILILSEIIPKTIGANNWRALAPFTVQSIRILMIILFPLVWMSQLITGFLKKNKDESVLSRADFAALAKTTAESGAIEKAEHSIIKNLLSLSDLVVRDIMTPRTVIMSAKADDTIINYYENHKPLRFSRIPIYDADTEDFIGMILKDEMLEEIVKNNGEKKLRDIKRDILYVQDNTALKDFMGQLIAANAHVALINDEYGSVVGVASMEDLFETLLGIEIMDETDNVEDLQKLARKRWEERAKKIGIIE